VPVAILRPGDTPDNTTSYDEEQAQAGSIPFMRGDDFIKYALGID
jgi:2,3-bisphosphoglycerate-independent phosphoglycerate mutase